jgi:hypothetical protein
MEMLVKRIRLYFIQGPDLVSAIETFESPPKFVWRISSAELMWTQKKKIRRSKELIAHARWLRAVSETKKFFQLMITKLSFLGILHTIAILMILI